MNIAVIGTGYVGLVSGACYAELGNNVVCVDSDSEKIQKLQQNIIPIYEPGLEGMVKKNSAAGRLLFTTSIGEAIRDVEVIFICVGTCSLKNGDADLAPVWKVAGEIAKHLNNYKLIVIKSTVPVGTTNKVYQLIRSKNVKKARFDVVFVPEFLKQGSAMNDTQYPERVIIGTDDLKTAETIIKLYENLNAPILVTDIKSAEMIKYACNTFLATKISFINEIANICECVGADISDVVKGMGYDSRISKHFLNAGIGFGGSCFPKDTKALINIARNAGHNFELLKVVLKINEAQRSRVISRLSNILGSLKYKTIGLWGLAFKPNTDDLREAPSTYLIRDLLKVGAKVRAYDPIANKNAKKVFNNVSFFEDPYAVAQEAHAIIIATEWDEFREVNLKRIKMLMKTPVIIDGRNILEPSDVLEAGIIYAGIGRRKSWENMAHGKTLAEGE